MTIELNPVELNLLTFALGIAAGSCTKDQKELFASLIQLANKVHANNPNWRPYR